MLLEYKRIHESVADRIQNWRSADKNDLVRAYEKNEDNQYLREGYVAAIICRYWGAINKYYSKSHSSNVTKEDCYEWLTHAIMYALKNKSWNKKFSSKKKIKVETLDENGNKNITYKWDHSESINSTYLDPKGPDKCINMCIASTRNIFYQSANNQNRSINFEKHMHLDDIFSEDEDSIIIGDLTTSPESSNFYSLSYTLISDLINKNRYIDAIILDGVINNDSFVMKKDAYDKPHQVFSSAKLSKHLRTIDDKYCKIFQSTYNADIIKVKECSKLLASQTSTKISKLIKNTFSGVSKNILDLKEDYCM